MLYLLTPGARAESVQVFMTGSEAREMVRASGGSPRKCRRLGLRHFRCQALYWYVRHEGEEVEPGVIVEVASQPISEERSIEVGFKGVKF